MSWSWRPARGHSAIASAIIAIPCLILIACGGPAKPAPPATPTSIWAEITRLAQATAVPTPTPRPAVVVVEAEPTFVPSADASRTLVVRSGSKSLAIDTDTGAARELLAAPASDAQSSNAPYQFSPDGASYAFACGRDASRTGPLESLCVRGARSPHTAPLFPAGAGATYNGSTLRSIQWSPDARYIAFERRGANADDDRYPDVFVLDLTTLVATRVVENSGHAPWGRVTWSPDSTRLAIQVDWNGSGATNLFVVDVVDGTMRDVGGEFNPAIRILSPVWSPDGSQVAFIGGALPSSSDAAGQTADLYVTSASGGGARRIASGARPSLAPTAWSPDGRWVAVTMDLPRAGSFVGAPHVFIERADGAEERALVDGISSSAYPSWSPDSSHLAFFGEFSGITGLFVTSIRGAAPRQLTDQRSGGYPFFMAWSADGERVFYIKDAFCGQGGCTPGYLYMTGLTSGATPVQVYGERVDEFLGLQP